MKRGFGTNFHFVYKNNAELYHVFSSAEVFSPNLMFRLKQLFTGKTMLDIACGTCHKTNLLSKYFKKVYALDISDNLLNYGKIKYKKNKKLNFILSSASKIPLPEKSVDTIFISWGSFPLTKTLREMKRVLKPGGVILRIGVLGRDEFTQLFPDFNLNRIKRIQKQFIKEGFLKEQHEVNIRFDNLESAKKVISKVLHVDERRVSLDNFKHNVLLFKYIKKRHDHI